jgi:hypothetical protein
MTKARDIASAAPAPSTVSATELGYLDGVSSAIQTQLNAKQAVVSGVNDTEIGYLDGVSSAIQTQIDGKTAKSTLTTTGDIYYASAANTPARLGIGSAGQTLTVSGGIPAWATPSSGGMTLISETVASALSSLSFSSLGSYKQLLLEWHNIFHSDASTRFKIRFNSDSGTNYYGNNYIAQDGSLTYNAAPSDNSVSVHPSFGEAVNNNTSARVFNCYGSLLVDNYTSTTKYKKFKIMFYYYNNSTSNYFSQLYSDKYWISTSAITSIDIVRISGSGTFSNLSDSSIRLYGIS